MLIDNCAWQTERAYDSREKAKIDLEKKYSKRYLKNYRYRIEEMILR